MNLTLKIIWIIICLLISINNINATKNNSDSNKSTYSLDGEWFFQLDPLNEGIENEWYKSIRTDTINLPGTTDLQQKGKLNTKSETGRFTRLYPYYGPAWYQKEIEVPEDWGGKELLLFMELTKASSVWVDKNFVGKKISLTAPHIYNLTKYLTPGKHLLSVRIDNSDNPPVGWPHQISDQTQTNWNGILGRIELQVKDPVWMKDVQVYPDIHQKKIDIKVRFNKKCSGKLILQASAWNTNTEHLVEPKEIDFETTDEQEYTTSLVIGDKMQLWDEFNSALYKLKILFNGDFEGKEVSDYKEIDFGMREFTWSHNCHDGVRLEIQNKDSVLKTLNLKEIRPMQLS